MTNSDRSSGDQTLCLVVPLFNEEDRVAESLDLLADYVAAWPVGSELIFVDDGSTDRTTEIVVGGIERHRTGVAKLIRRTHAGKGSAVRSGLLEATTDLAAFCDVDLATPLDQLDLIINTASAGTCLAVGSRAAQEAEVKQRESRRREFAGKAYNGLVRAWLCPGINDTQCGAKAAPTFVWRSILAHSREDGFAWDVETIALAFRLGFPVRELGIQWFHDERSRVRVLRDGAAMVFATSRIGLNVRRVQPRPASAQRPARGDSLEWLGASDGLDTEVFSDAGDR